jgi:carbamoyl-phosphate synthase large subunit
MPRGGFATSWDEAREIVATTNYPAIIRPSFTLGGTGGGTAYNPEEFEEIVRRGLAASPIQEVLIEESILGWKEFELEVMRDLADNVVIICSIENFDPMGVHTGDSITVAPAQTLTDREYQTLRDMAIRVIRKVGVETGGSNIQFGVNPENGEIRIIEMNPRVSRSSALASKATGFPIAKIAAKLAVGYRLHELPNDITRETTACFEPSIDYVVTKAPRFAFEKFPEADDTLTTQMKSVGETMAIGSTFKESFQKALRGLEIGSFGFGCDGSDLWGTDEQPDDAEIRAKLSRPGPKRAWYIRYAFKSGMSVAEVYELSAIDPWFLDNLLEIVETEDRLRTCGGWDALDADLLRTAKRFGFSDRQLAVIFGRTEMEVRKRRLALGIRAVFKSVDTCAAEFEAYTPYYYSTYETEDEVPPRGAMLRSRTSGPLPLAGRAGEGGSAAVAVSASSPASPLPNPHRQGEGTGESVKRIMILGGGPNRIGQGIEFDYCCCHASFALREMGVESIMVNSNPETVSTDYDTSDLLFFEPLTVEDVLNICDRVEPDGIIVQFGGQTPLNLARALADAGAPIIGTSVEAIEAAEDREKFSKMIERLGLKQPPNGMARTMDEARVAAEQIGYPILVRPSFVLGGRAMEICYDQAQLERFVAEAFVVAQGQPVLIDSFLEGATEVDCDAVSDGVDVIVPGIMEHIEEAGVHSGDSACAIPPYSLPGPVVKEIRDAAEALARDLKVVGLMNVQFAVKWEEEARGAGREARVSEEGSAPRASRPAPRASLRPVVYVLEVNPRASRTVPFVAKATGMPVAKIAAKAMAGVSLAEQGYTSDPVPAHVSVKESVFPFIKFAGVDIVLGPEMRSTGEVMGVSERFSMAFAKSQLAAGTVLPSSGNIFVSVADKSKPAIADLAFRLHGLGYSLLATDGTAKLLEAAGIPTRRVKKISEGHPNLLDFLTDGEVALVMNTPRGKGARTDEGQIRAAAVQAGVPCLTTIEAATAAVRAMEALRNEEMAVQSLQDRFPA